MNCQDFNAVAGELADGRLMEAAAREAGLRHASACASCAARLMDVRAVGAALHVASKAETEEAPARVKQALLAAFAERQRVAATPAVSVFSRRRVPRWFGAAALAATAAAILLALTLPSLVRVPTGGPRVSAPELNVAENVPAESKPSVEEGGASKESVESHAPKTLASDLPAKRVAPRARKYRSVVHSRPDVNAESVAQSSGNDYLPLTHLAVATAMESGTVVRVELSRSALISLGVPVSADSSDQLLKAEVVIGDDGVARAIRLVR